MNKTLLLIICDFLLLNLLALTSWEKAEPTRPARVPVTQGPASAATREQDLVEAMRLSLTDEENARRALNEQLSAREQSLSQTQAERERLAQNLASTQEKASALQSKLGEATEDAAATRARLAQLQRELDLKQAEAERQKQQLGALEKAQVEAASRIENLSVAVKVAEKEKILLKETTETLKQQVQAERIERQKVQETTVQLAQGVGQLAENSGQLTKEIRENRPINANILFNDFLSNRIALRISGEKEGGFLGPTQRSATTHCVVVSDGSMAYALFHIDETPFSFREIISDWRTITLELQRGEAHTEANSFSFHQVDPRIIAVPVDAQQIAALGVKVYPLSADPFKFPEAMLISRGGSGYGETPFKLDQSQPSYVRMDNRFFKRLFGDFSPSRGDLVLSKSGDFLGIMVSSDYCAVVSDLKTLRTLKVPDTRGQGLDKILSEMEDRVNKLPFRMQ